MTSVTEENAGEFEKAGAEWDLGASPGVNGLYGGSLAVCCVARCRPRRIHERS